MPNLSKAQPDRPQLSVVIPALDEAAIISQTLLPLQGFRGAGLELLVVDGGSADDTVRIAGPLADQVLSSQPGRALQMNRGLAAARGDLVWFLHADSGLGARHVQSLLGCRITNTTWGFFALRIDSGRTAYRVIERAINWRSRFSRIGTGDQGLFASRELLASIGGFALLPLMEDLDLCDRLQERSPPTLLGPPLATSARRWQQQGIVRTVLTMWLLRGAWRLGISAERLARWYARVR